MDKKDKMNRIILIGNGFDLAHGLKTGYKDFMAWFWVNQITIINETESKDWKTVDGENDSYKIYQNNDFFDVKFYEKEKGYITNYDKPQEEKIKNITRNENDNEADTVSTDQRQRGKNLKFKKIEEFQKNIDYKNKFLEIVVEREKLQNWVDIEELYFELLKNCKDRYKQSKNVYEIYKVEQLNKDFMDIKRKLAEFLKKRNQILVENQENQEYRNKLTKSIVAEIKKIISEKDTENTPNKIILLNFNYTNTVSVLYVNDIKGAEEIQIHGQVDTPDNQMIFGYGDEISSDSIDIENLNENAFLENVKSIKYIETNNYSRLLEFIDECKYDVFVFGHSCGNSDRTLLKALFEHENCVKIRCFYHNDDYIKTIDNIYRKFEYKKDFRIKICKRDKEKDVFPQFKGVSPFKDEGILPFENEIETIKEDKLPVEKKSSIEKQHDIEIYKKENMVEVVFAYKEKKFYIGKCQVTQELWQDIMGANPSYFQANGANMPVECVSWYNCIEFCNKLSEKYELRKYYNINGNDITFNITANGFRLPKDEEWEHAARYYSRIDKKECKYYAGSTYNSNNDKDDESELANYAWFDENSNRTTHEVGNAKSSSELAIHDMSGNVWEWCEERCSRDSDISKVVLDEQGSYRVLRGGCWGNYAWRCRVSYRDSYAPDGRIDGIGFRLALVP